MVNREPTDDDLEAVLRAMTPEQWDELWVAAAAVGQEGPPARWEGGQQIGTSVVDGVERPVHQVPYPVYSEAVDRLRAAVAGAGLIVPFSWPDWPGTKAYAGGGRGLDTAPATDAVRLLTAIIRSERFSEGSIEATLEDGTFVAALNRLRRWQQEQAT